MHAYTHACMHTCMQLSLGKAAYLATGRGLAIEHVPFHKLYVFLSTSCFVPGMPTCTYMHMRTSS